nr:CBS domain-containing protein [Bacteroidota bacterium]
AMEKVMEKFRTTGYYNLPVVDDGKYVGFVSRANIFNAYKEDVEGGFDGMMGVLIVFLLMDKKTRTQICYFSRQPKAFQIDLILFSQDAFWIIVVMYFLKKIHKLFIFSFGIFSIF